MSEEKKNLEPVDNHRLPTFAEAITPIIAMLVILTIGKGKFGYATEPLLILVAGVAALIAIRLGYTWG